VDGNITVPGLSTFAFCRVRLSQPIRDSTQHNKNTVTDIAHLSSLANTRVSWQAPTRGGLAGHSGRPKRRFYDNVLPSLPRVTMIELTTPRGLPVRVPEDLSEDFSTRFEASQWQAAKEYYEENGYVIFGNVIASEMCDRIRDLWDKEVKPFTGYMYRQTTARAEKHSKNERGWIMNPVLNLQSVNPFRFPQFRKFATENILANARLRDAFSVLLNDAPKIVQSMYFEGNSETWEHQDSYYLDSETIGEMCGAWIAVENISPTAGRFFVCPQSQRIKLKDHSLFNNIAENHEAYISSVVDEIRKRSLEIRAPALSKGDVLFFNALTMHGSLKSQDPNNARSSITCHAIPLAKNFLQFQTRVMRLKTSNLNGTSIFKPKDLASPKNRAILYIESHYPTPFYWLKKKAIVHVLKEK
jgi:phytanoyl-CoA hydroxylase